MIIIVPGAARTRAELRNELINHGDINAAIKISAATYWGFEGVLSRNFTAQMWAQRAATLRVKLPLKLLFPFNTLIFHRLLLGRGWGSSKLPPKKHRERVKKSGIPPGLGEKGLERQEGQGELLLLLFSDVSPRTPRRFRTRTRLDCLQNNGADPTPGFGGTDRSRLRLAPL